MYQKAHYLILGATLLLLTSCWKERIVKETVEKEYTWNSDLNLANDHKILLNGHLAGNHVYLLDLNILADIPVGPIAGNIPPSNWIHSLKMGINDQPRMAEHYYVAGIDDYLYIPTYAVYPQTKLRLLYPALDTSFGKFAFPPRWLGSNVGAIDNYVLVPYLDKSDSKVMLFTLIKLQYKYLLSSESRPTAVDTVWTKKIQLDNPGRAPYVFDISAINGRFFTTVGDRTYAIDTLGTVQQSFGFPMSQFFSDASEERYYGLSQYGEIYLSYDKGYTWNFWFGGGDIGWRDLRFVRLFDKLVAFDEFKIYLVNTDDLQTLELRELKNDGLFNSRITALLPFNDTTVYATTLSGGYYCHRKTFFKPK